MSELIKKQNYNLVTNSSRIIKELNQKLIFKNIDNDLTEMYLDYLEETYTLEEIKLMKKTLENEISTKASRQSIFIGTFGIVVALIMMAVSTLTSSTEDAHLKQGLFSVVLIFIAFYSFILIYYFFSNDILLDKRVKLVNHFNLLIGLKESNISK